MSDTLPENSALLDPVAFRDGLASYKKRFARWLAILAAVFVLGIVCGATVFKGDGKDDTTQDWVGQMATYHLVSGSVVPGENPNPDKWLGAEIEVGSGNLPPFRIFQLDDIEVLRVDRVAPDGSPLTQYSVASEKADLSTPVVGYRGGLPTATWTKGGFEYLLIGTVDGTVIYETAQSLSQR